MKFFLSIFDNTLNRPYSKFLLNIFILKNNFYFNFKNIIYIHLFTNVQKIFKIKILKFNYIFFKNTVIYFTIINILIQLYLIIVLI
jgi:hypothetical protein